MEPNKVLTDLKQLNKMKDGLYNIISSIDAGNNVNTIKTIKAIIRCQLQLTNSIKTLYMEVMEKGPKSGVDALKDMAKTMGVDL